MARSPDHPAGVTICMRCGDQGYSNAFVYCVECLEYAVHRYCLDDIPETLDEFIRWLCDDCKAKVVNQLTVQSPTGTKDVPQKVRNDTILMLHNDSVICQSKEKEHENISQQLHGACAKIDSKETSRLAGDDSLVKMDLNGRVISCFDQSCDAQAITESDSHAQPKKLDLKEKLNATSLIVGEDGQRQLSRSFNQSCVETIDCTTQGQPVRGHEWGQPVIDIIWEGCFTISNKNYDVFDGLVAHLSVKACERVYMEAKSFPPMLKFEMHPKSALWPKSFLATEPTDENIALYFFPANTKCERGFDYLVEIMMREELALRAILESSELLVFTSQELPILFRRFKGKYYLWGVFRGKKRSSDYGMAPKGTNNAISYSNTLNIGASEAENAVKTPKVGMQKVHLSPRARIQIGE